MIKTAIAITPPTGGKETKEERKEEVKAVDVYYREMSQEYAEIPHSPLMQFTPTNLLLSHVARLCPP